MSEGFTIANFRTVAHGPQEGQFAVGERKKAFGPQRSRSEIQTFARRAGHHDARPDWSGR